ncbi:MAG: hypothetical protein WCJ84_05355 [Candidatus Peregrinibacteria bacterium]
MAFEHQLGQVEQQFPGAEKGNPFKNQIAEQALKAEQQVTLNTQQTEIELQIGNLMASPPKGGLWCPNEEQWNYFQSPTKMAKVLH